MSLVDKLFEKSSWERFHKYKSGLRCSKKFTKELRDFIDSESYLKYSKEILSCSGLPLPSKSVISKMSSQKRRTVYKYPYEYNMVLHNDHSLERLAMEAKCFVDVLLEDCKGE